MKILVTGGTGYIGSHTVVRLIENKYDVVMLDNLSNSKKDVVDKIDVVIVDNLSNSKEDVVDKIQTITKVKPIFYKADLLDKDAVSKIVKKEKPDAVIHFAGLKAVGESVEQPLRYYHNNITGTVNLLEVMAENGIKDFVFSSSATVYGNPKSVPINENFPLSTTNPYGATKLMIENILRDLYNSDTSMNIAILRYFNPVGAHKSGLIGENPNGIPNNLVPYMMQVAAGKLDYLRVFGDDYKTKDGTGVRDYIHVEDLAEGHLLALKKLKEKPGIVTYNLGTGVGYSVLEMVKEFSSVLGRDLPYKIIARRPGDIDACYADTALAKKEIGFEAKRGLHDMFKDGWNFQKNS
ncbi:MAG: UDP-glucose 4-epimerase GalE [Clostridiales bacterium]|jgi:UDP-glucose 4-epimerase|nr:UDP-glucose 4-epimerase GalE [Clostridiales bacterium]